jgi:hypothetical protein
MSDTSPPPLTNTADMIALHNIFRKAFGSAPEVIAASAPEDKARSAVVGSYYDNILRLLHAHHDGEDELIWPKLLERCPSDAEMISEVAGQHQVVVPLADEAMTQLGRWTSSASEEDGVALAKVLVELNDALSTHLQEEETKILPLCSRYMTPAEWAQLPEHGLKHFDGDKPWLIFGLILDNMPPQARGPMMERMPPPAQDMWANFGQGAYTDFIAQVAVPA